MIFKGRTQICTLSTASDNYWRPEKFPPLFTAADWSSALHAVKADCHQQPLTPAATKAANTAGASLQWKVGVRD